MLIAAMIFLFRPGIARDYMFPPYERLAPSKVVETVASLDPGDTMRIVVDTDTGKEHKLRVLALPVGEGDGRARLEAAGLFLEERDGKLTVADVGVNSRAEKIGLDIADDHVVVGIDVPLEQPPKFLFSLPGLALFGLVALTQVRRKRSEERFAMAKSTVFS